MSSPIRTNLVLELIADNIVGVDGSPVATWPDTSGNGNDATQADANKQPALRLDAVNGHAAIQGDGVDDMMATPSISLGEIFVVIRSATSGVYSAYLSILYGGTRFFVTDSGTTSLYPNSADKTWVDNVETLETAPIEDWKILGAQKASASTGACQLFNDPGGTPGNFLIAEVLVYSAAQSDADRLLVEAYLDDKYINPPDPPSTSGMPPLLIGPRRGIISYSLGASYDPDAQAFFTAAGIADPTQKSAVNQLVLDLKSESLWTPMRALYPFVGGSSSSCSFNLKNVAQFQITWHGTPAFNANGVTGNGTDAYGDTGLPQDSLTQTSNAWGVYCRTATSENVGVIGCTDGVELYEIFDRFSDDKTYFDNPNPARISVSVATAAGLVNVSRTATAVVAGYQNGSSIVAGTDSEGVGAAATMKLLTITGSTFSTRNLALAFISNGLTAGNMTALYAVVQAFQTTLGRQV